MVEVLLIPPQTGTPDSCNATHEESIIDFQTTYGLKTWGWIHTHPTQSCFLSSIDLHTHFNYQKTLDEAIAIVYAPLKTPR